MLHRQFPVEIEGLNPGQPITHEAALLHLLSHVSACPGLLLSKHKVVYGTGSHYVQAALDYSGGDTTLDCLVLSDFREGKRTNSFTLNLSQEPRS